MGLHTDRMVLDTRALQGEAPRVVSWLAGQAGPGEVLVSEATWRQVRGAFETERLGTRDFTGLSGPAHLDVHRVLREHELRRLLERWDEVREGQGAFVSDCCSRCPSPRVLRCTGSPPSGGGKRRMRRWWTCSGMSPDSDRCSSLLKTCIGRTPPGSSPARVSDDS